MPSPQHVTLEPHLQRSVSGLTPLASALSVATRDGTTPTAKGGGTPTHDPSAEARMHSMLLGAASAASLASGHAAVAVGGGAAAAGGGGQHDDDGIARTVFRTPSHGSVGSLDREALSRKLHSMTPADLAAIGVEKDDATPQLIQARSRRRVTRTGAELLAAATGVTPGAAGTPMSAADDSWNLAPRRILSLDGGRRLREAAAANAAGAGSSSGNMSGGTPMFPDRTRLALDTRQVVSAEGSSSSSSNHYASATAGTPHSGTGRQPSPSPTAGDADVSIATVGSVPAEEGSDSPVPRTASGSSLTKPDEGVADAAMEFVVAEGGDDDTDTTTAPAGRHRAPSGALMSLGRQDVSTRDASRGAATPPVPPRRRTNAGGSLRHAASTAPGAVHSTATPPRAPARSVPVTSNGGGGGGAAQQGRHSVHSSPQRGRSGSGGGGDDMTTPPSASGKARPPSPVHTLGVGKSEAFTPDDQRELLRGMESLFVGTSGLGAGERAIAARFDRQKARSLFAYTLQVRSAGVVLSILYSLLLTHVAPPPCRCKAFEVSRGAVSWLGHCPS